MSDESLPPVSPRRAAERRIALSYLEKIRDYVAAYERGGEEGLRSLASFDADWAQIQRYQRWAVTHFNDDPVAHDLCHRYAERGARLLPLLNTEQALAWLLPAIEAAQKLQLPKAELTHRRNLGLIYDRAGRHDEARASYQAALEMAAAEEDAVAQADLRHRIGKVYRNLGKRFAPEAERWYAEALEAMQAIGDPCGEARVRIDLGNVRANQGFYTEALEHFAPARELLDLPECGDSRDEALLLGYLGNAYRNLGQYQQADEAYRAAAAMAAALRERKVLAEQRFNQALLYRDVGNIGAMETCLKEAQAEAQTYGGGRDIAKLQNGFGSLYALQGDFPAAIDAHDTAIRMLSDAGAHFLADYAQADKGRTLLMASYAGEALELLTAASGGGHPLHRQQRAALLAQAHLLLGDTATAEALLTSARELDSDPNTVASRHRVAALHAITLARSNALQTAKVLPIAIAYATNRIDADSWELAAFISRSLALATQALLATDGQCSALLAAAAEDLDAAIQRCGTVGFRTETATLFRILAPLDPDRKIEQLCALCLGG